MIPLLDLRKRTVLVVLGLLVAACETPPPREHVLDSMDDLITEAVQSQPDSSVPTSIADALLPALVLDTIAPPEAGDQQRFDISVDGVPATQFFLSLVEGTRFNMVIHPEVHGEVTLNLRDVTILEVMEAVRDVYGFEFVRTGYGFQVLPGRLQARIYQVNFLNVLRSGDSSSFVSAGTLTDSSGSSNSNNDDDTDTIQDSDTSVLLGTRITTRQPETAFWQEVQGSIQAIVGPGEGRSVVVNPQSGVVVVRALPTEHREVEAFLRATQQIVQRQVIIEAKILEVELSERFQTGINWSLLLEAGTTDALFGQTGGGTVLVNEGNTTDIIGQAGNLDPQAFDAISSGLASAFGGVFSLALNSEKFNVFIELLKLQGNVQVLSSPRISTLNNQKALIKVGQDEFFVTDVSNTTTVGTTTTSAPTVELTPFFSGIALDVTPQISERGVVTLHIHPTVSQVVDQQKSISLGGVNQTLPLALSTVRETDSIVRALNGQVVVVGGLMLDQIDDDQAKIPILGDIPGVGQLFRQQLKRTVKSELVILLRPIVVDNDTQWSGALAESSESLYRLRKELRERETPPAALQQ